MQYPIISVEKTGQRIKEACEGLGVCAKDIQKYMNFASTQSIYDWFRGKNLPSLDNFYALARYLDIPMESLIVDVDSPPEGTRRRASYCECTITRTGRKQRIVTFYIDALRKIA